MYFLQGSLHWSKGGGEAPGPDDISRKLFQKFCKEYVGERKLRCIFYRIVRCIQLLVLSEVISEDLYRICFER